MQSTHQREVRSFGASDIGRFRKVNQDAYLRDDDLGLYVVADGMGGHAAGEVASLEAVDTLYGMIKRGLASMGDKLSSGITEDNARAACRLVEGAVQAATYMVFAMAELDREKSGMGTTISALLVLGNHAVIGQVGDSRVYQVRGGKAVQLTEDHTLIAWELKQGLITPEQAKHSPHKNIITRAVGNRDYVQVDTSLVELHPADRYLLCSDGLHGYLRTEEIAHLCMSDGQSVVENLIHIANARGGKDNITAVLVEVL
ncbi:MAG TPA: protein phosphatase 2C domain-containing protein [Polyangiaceae bacterium]|mgnify:CR=1 FL=1|jgi:protein phosphatase|nr:MAG: Serine/threonine phosphatase stp [Deltaproteobacteria bacterium ADurb.Bin207]HNS98856.1 protein phosphatase 2C domain-containing protein [Polyangiaceae bacterium]HNZ23720.1 protein phosphatase 2C domain-containing protein [Polyangiaceae bacterium]HOD24870.1 protein phosphatase 2C domain-containing protein [Polyangiaceae bacterium]HOE48945.1 protein phosphatase 2C domain-containing protein [Polyangiaceae bacterium]